MFAFKVVVTTLIVLVLAMLGLVFANAKKDVNVCVLIGIMAVVHILSAVAMWT